MRRQKFQVVSLAASLVFSWWCLPFLLRPSPLPVLGDFLILFMLFMAGLVMWPLVTVMYIAMNGANLIKGIGWTDLMAASLLPALMIYEGVRILALKRDALVHVMVLHLAILGWFWLAWQGLFAGGLNLMGKN